MTDAANERLDSFFAYEQGLEDARAWTTGEGPKALFDAAAGWLGERRVLLPGVTTLARLVASVREAANQRLWDALYGLLNTGQRAVLDSLLTVPPGARVSELDRLRRGPVRVSGPQMKWSLQRAEEIADLGMGVLDVSAVPPRRLAELSRYGVDGKASLLRRHGDSRRLATLLATAVYLTTRAVDDALDLLEVRGSGVRLFGQRSVLDDVLHDEGGGQALDAGEPGQLLVVEQLKRGQVGGCDPQKVVGLAEQALRLQHVRDGGHGLFEGGDGVGGFPAQGGEDEGLEVQADGAGVDDCPVAADGALAFEVAQPAVAGRDAELHAGGQLGDGQAAVELQLGKNLPVHGIHEEDSSPQHAIMR